MIELVESDAFEALSDIRSSSAHCAIIDYPWEFDSRNGSQRFGYDDDEKPDFYQTESIDKIDILFDEIRRVLVKGAWVLCFADDIVQDDIRAALKRNFTFRRNWAWSTDNIGMGYYGRVNHYPIPVATNGETDRLVRDRPTLYQIGPTTQKTSYHSEKPVKLYRKLLEEPVLRSGERLIEPFCGSGPGAQVARERFRDDIHYWGCDINPEAIRMAEARSTKRPKSLLDV